MSLFLCIVLTLFFNLKLTYTSFSFYFDSRTIFLIILDQESWYFIFLLYSPTLGLACILLIYILFWFGGSETDSSTQFSSFTVFNPFCYFVFHACFILISRTIFLMILNAEFWYFNWILLRLFDIFFINFGFQDYFSHDPGCRVWSLLWFILSRCYAVDPLSPTDDYHIISANLYQSIEGSPLKLTCSILRQLHKNSHAGKIWELSKSDWGFSWNLSKF